MPPLIHQPLSLWNEGHVWRSTPPHPNLKSLIILNFPITVSEPFLLCSFFVPGDKGWCPPAVSRHLHGFISNQCDQSISWSTHVPASSEKPKSVFFNGIVNPPPSSKSETLVWVNFFDITEDIHWWLLRTSRAGNGKWSPSKKLIWHRLKRWYQLHNKNLSANTNILNNAYCLHPLLSFSNWCLLIKQWPRLGNPGVC